MRGLAGSSNSRWRKLVPPASSRSFLFKSHPLLHHLLLIREHEMEKESVEDPFFHQVFFLS